MLDSIYYLFGLLDSLFNNDTWRTISLTGVAVGQTLFVLLYATFPFYKTFFGRALFYKALMLALITDVFVAARVFDFSGLDILFSFLYFLLGIGVWWQFFAFLRVRYAGTHNRTNPGHDGKASRPEPFPETNVRL